MNTPSLLLAITLSTFIQPLLPMNHRSLVGHSESINSVAFNPHNPDQIASGADDKTVRLWDLNTGIYTNTLEGYSGWVYSVAFNPHNPDQIASGADDEL